MAYGFLIALVFAGAGYYGAVRALTLHFSFDWVNLRSDDEKQRHFILDWRRKLRLMRLLLIASGCFLSVVLVLEKWERYQGVPDWTLLIILFAAVSVLWMAGQSLWVRIGQAYPQTMALERFPVRFAEWLITPVYWLIEPFVDNEEAERKVAMAVREESGLATEEEVEDDRVDEQMLRNALEFKDVRLKDCMIPRTEISGVDVDDTIENLKKAFISSGHSKIVVYNGSVDNVIGYCHSLALFRKPKDISSIVTPMLTVPEAMPASDLMLRFLEERKNLAIVVDEFGGTAGLVSMEDILEQIFGEIQDEYDSTEDWVERQLDAHTYLLSARHEIDYLNENYGWNLPEGEYDTLGGLVIAVYEDLPAENDVIKLPPYTFKVEVMQGNRIELIRVILEP